MMGLVRTIRLIRADPASLFSEMMVDRNYVVSFVNAHAINLACRNAEFLSALESSDLLLRDGVGLQLLLRALGKDPALNMNGTDFIPELILASKSHLIALCGSTARSAATAAAWLEQNGAQQITHCDGFRSPDYYVGLVKALQPRVVILGMGMPKQELLSARLARELPGPILIVNGGAILDFLANRVRRAPRFMRKLGLEWVFRLILEPSRLWRRYLVGNLIFLWRTAQVMPLSTRNEGLSTAIAPAPFGCHFRWRMSQVSGPMRGYLPPVRVMKDGTNPRDEKNRTFRVCP
ncbi:MAG: WecB/TagA/CpsF family glycosyltransferase [Steroidobacteraceae bacterium]